VDEIYKAVQLCAARVRSFALETSRAFDYGIKPGIGEPWSLPFQVAATPIYLETVPSEHLGATAYRFAQGLASLVEIDAPSADREAWTIVTCYLESYVAAVTDIVGKLDEGHVLLAHPDVDPAAPSILRFDLIAQMADIESLQTLYLAADRIEVSCREQVVTLLTPTEQAILIAKANGSRLLDIATEYGYSERSFYRELRKIWARLGTSNRSQGLAEAVRLGYI